MRPCSVAHIALCSALTLALAGPAAAGQSKLLLTGGVSSIDGAAGGGLTPWAVTGSHATRGECGATAAVTQTRTRDYRLGVAGVAASCNDRVEVSLARQDFDTGSTGTALGLPGLHLKQTIAGLKLRIAGDAVLDSDRWMPQLAVGVQFKRLDAGGLAPTLDALGANRRGTDLTLHATKLLLAQGVLVNATLRATKANQNGLLGFGGSGHSKLRLQPEVSLAWLFDRRAAVGVEYRAKPDNLNSSMLGAALREDDWKDIFIAWAPNKQVSLTLAWVELGRIVPGIAAARQHGTYLSAQVGF
jgi:Protein of unknown function (DUF3034)